jgi:hypothetical protein
MILANSLFVKNHSDPSIEEYAINLLFKIKDVYHTEWEKDWKNDIYLAELCSITWRDKDAFELHRQTYNKFSDPPEAVLIAMASCRNSPPGSLSSTDEEAEKLLKQAFDKKPSYEAALMLKSLYHAKGDSRQKKYWEAMCQEAEKKNIHSEKTIPNVFSEKMAG